MSDRVERFLKVSGYEANIKRVTESMLNGIRDVLIGSGVSAAYAMEGFELVKKAMETRRPELTSATVAIFREAYTDEEMDALIAFYETPVGMKVVHLSSVLHEQFAKAGEQWAAAAVEDVLPALNALDVKQ